MLLPISPRVGMPIKGKAQRTDRVNIPSIDPGQRPTMRAIMVAELQEEARCALAIGLASGQSEPTQAIRNKGLCKSLVHILCCITNFNDDFTYPPLPIKN